MRQIVGSALLLTILICFVNVHFAFADAYQTERESTTAVGNPPTTGGGTGGGTGSSLGHPATSNPCPNAPMKNQYAFDFANNAIFSPKNFGDPVCDYTLNGLATLIKQKDPGINSKGISHFYCWYNVIAKNESGYDPNAEQLVDTLDPAHAWGNFQMGRGLNGPDDHGDVDWQSQVINAIHRNAAIGGTFAYWGTVRYDPVACQK